MQRTTDIRPLKNDDFRIIKELIIVSDKHYNYDIEIGRIYYLRKFTENYKFKPIVGKDSLDKLLNFNAQEKYPNDLADEIIFQSLKNNFPKSIIRNHSLLFTSDLSNLNAMLNHKSKKCRLQITPDFSEIDLSKYANSTFEGLEVDINIYAHFTIDSISNIFLYGYYDLNNKDVLDMIQTIEFK